MTIHPSHPNRFEEAPIHSRWALIAHPPVDRKTVFASNVELAHYRHTLLVFDDLD
jgi:hypothetical protein